MWFKLILTALLLTGRTTAENEEEEEEDDEEYGNQPTTPRPPPPIPLMNMSELAKWHHYEIEEFELKATDGQKLALFHVKPKKAGGPAVILQHGFITSPDSWCMTNDSLAYRLTDEGADVWLPSTRGNIYSRKHEKYNPDTDREFWDFSFVEMAEIDFPVFVDFILEKTKQPSLYYVGHSMGTTIALIALSQKPEYNAKIKEAFLMAPIWQCTKYQFMLNKESSIYTMLVDVLKGWDDTKKWEAFPRVDMPVTDHQLKCNHLPEMGIPYCEMGMDMVYGLVGEYVPAGASIKVIKHYAQAYVNGQVLPWEFDTPELNKKAYNQEMPPEYDIKKVTAKMNLFWVPSDQLVDATDVEKLSAALPNVGVKHITDDENFSHADFVMASNHDVFPLTDKIHQKIVDIVKGRNKQ